MDSTGRQKQKKKRLIMLAAAAALFALLIAGAVFTLHLKGEELPSVSVEQEDPDSVRLYVRGESYTLTDEQRRVYEEELQQKQEEAEQDTPEETLADQVEEDIIEEQAAREEREKTAEGSDDAQDERRDEQGSGTESEKKPGTNPDPSADPSATPTRTPTPTVTPPGKPTPSAAPSAKPTPTPGVTPSEKPTPTPRVTPSEKPTPTPAPETCTVILDYGDGREQTTFTGLSAGTVFADFPDESEMTREGYLFLGWYDTKDPSGTRYSREEPCIVRNDRIFYAVWEAEIPTYRVTLDFGSGAEPWVSDPIRDGGVFDAFPDASDERLIRAGFRFDGWLDENEGPAEASYTVQEDLFFHAAWTDLRPVIETDLTDEIYPPELMFSVRAFDRNGNRIDRYFYTVYFDDFPISSTSVDYEGFAQYRASGQENGQHSIRIVVRESDRADAPTREETYEITVDESAYQQTEEQATLIMDANALGFGVLLEASDYLYPNESAASFVQRVLEDNGFTAVFEPGYLVAVGSPGLAARDAVIPEALARDEWTDGVDLSAGYRNPDYLGDAANSTYGSWYAADAGWMFACNGVLSEVGLGEVTLTDGDEIRLTYALFPFSSEYMDILLSM